MVCGSSSQGPFNSLGLPASRCGFFNRCVSSTSPEQISLDLTMTLSETRCCLFRIIQYRSFINHVYVVSNRRKFHVRVKNEFHCSTSPIVSMKIVFAMWNCVLAKLLADHLYRRNLLILYLICCTKISGISLTLSNKTFSRLKQICK